ncbi:erythromycin esterase family protein [Massilia sp. W12]|uniref:erythromycin esterase family protein n=1 Tax=Massilia sp. W12 TaxID=3126507 RepID=UPI0030D0ACF4
MATPPSSVNLEPDLTQAKLLSDDELATSALATGFTPTAQESAWLQQNHRKIRSLVFDRDFSDLAFLRQELAGKRIVQLGESSHGSREFNQIKVRMVKFMHQELGYNVLAFESSLIGCHLQDQEYLARRSVPPRQACVFAVWATQELDELFRYIDSTQASSRPLRLAGFDWQESSTPYDNAERVSNWLAPVLRQTNDAALQNTGALIEAVFALAQKGTACASAPAAASCQAFLAEGARYEQEMARLIQTFEPYRAQADDSQRFVRNMAYLGLQSLQDRLLSLRARHLDPHSYQGRDPAMARSISGLAKLAYPQEKIMVWAHNAHISRASQWGSAAGAPMGSYLAKEWQDQLFTIGLFMLRGENANNFRNSMPVRLPPADSLEAYAHSLRLGALYLPIPARDAAGDGDNWLHRPLNFMNWGMHLQLDRLDQHFDAAIVIDRSRIPAYN